MKESFQPTIHDEAVIEAASYLAGSMFPQISDTLQNLLMDGSGPIDIAVNVNVPMFNALLETISTRNKFLDEQKEKQTAALTFLDVVLKQTQVQKANRYKQAVREKIMMAIVNSETKKLGTYTVNLDYGISLHFDGYRLEYTVEVEGGVPNTRQAVYTANSLERTLSYIIAIMT